MFVQSNKLSLFIIFSVVIGIVLGQQHQQQQQQQQNHEELLFWSNNGVDSLDVKVASPSSFTVKQPAGSSNNKILCLHSYTINNVADDVLLANDAEIQSIEITYNQHTSNNIITESPASRANLYSRYPSIGSESPLLSIVVDYVDTSKKVVTEHFSTVKQMSLNDTAELCKSIEPLIGHPLLPLNQSPLSSLVYMGLVPRDLAAPLFVAGDRPSQLTSSNSIKQRFFQQQIDFTLGGMMSSLSLLENQQQQQQQQQQKQQQPTTTTTTTANSIKPSRISWSLSSTKYIGRTIKLVKNQVTGQINIHFNEVIEISASNVAIESSSILQSVSTATNGHKHTVQLFTGLTDNVETHNKQQANFTATIISREARKQGFHRELFTSIQLNSLNTNNAGQHQQHCSILLLEHFDQGAFVDRYEVDELKRFGGPSVYLYQLIDLEKPSYTSTQNFVSVTKPITTTESSNIDITLPFHLRYQNPGTTINRVSTVLPPVLFISCSDNSNQQQQQPPHWERITITKEVPTLHIETPVGQLGVRSFVIVFTLLVTVVGSLIVILAIVYSNTKDRFASKNK
ncbi:phosphatidylinositol glycan [Heterostelium album PN500]|uniref:Phosphatidylinositol glycan n=1 Tax=Heterostelium pallidum (strain ATCC 26659 / Pp 5 / PN500) TaxID=670386 RepID=D3BRR8_HETP5|nr:phosphatidylinositol glycan [Heterostelium album PN500]EFA76100.1 phosphatidylinositol glycan [Heterostelium album PN500]|eukprot:XP_020428234.1 phosphatidylinositol glycan [Heterostelium album PN500]